MILEIHRVAGFRERAGPLVRQHEDVRALVDREGLQQVERVIVVTLGVRFVELDFDALVAAGGREHLVERVAGGDDVAGAQRTGSIRARPHLDHDVFRKRRCVADAHDNTAATVPATAYFQFMMMPPPFGHAVSLSTALRLHAHPRYAAGSRAYWCR